MTTLAAAVAPAMPAELAASAQRIRAGLILRAADPADAGAIHALIAAHLHEGHLLPRSEGEIAAHAERFTVAGDGTDLLGCSDLAPLSPAVAEVRSLVVSSAARSQGIGRRLLGELVRQATVSGFDTLCAFTHAPSFFLQAGFSIVPHTWLPEKIAADCRACPRFRRCGQHAVMLPLVRSRHARVPLASLHG